MYWSTCANYFTFPGSQEKGVSDLLGDLFFCKWTTTSCCAQTLPGLDLNGALRLLINFFLMPNTSFLQYNWRNNLKTCKWKLQTPVSATFCISAYYFLIFYHPFSIFFQIKHPCMTPLKSDSTVEIHTASHEEYSSSYKGSLLLPLATEKKWEQSNRPPGKPLDNARWV